MRSIQRFILAGLLAMAGMVSVSNAFEGPGLYFDPAQPGFGMALAEGSAGFSGTFFVNSPDGEQAWFVTETAALGGEVVIYQPSGLFPALVHDLGEPVGAVTMTPMLGGLRVQYRFDLWGPRCDPRPQPGPLPPVCQGTWRFVKLAD